MMPDRVAKNDKPSLLGCSILSAYPQIVQRPKSKKGRKRYINAPPKSTHNPCGKLTDQPLEW
ncbi:hypothetical protein RDABS01_016364 [Bienertia sinuspersici]